MFSFTKVDCVPESVTGGNKVSKYKPLFDGFMKSGYRYAVIVEDSSSKNITNRLSSYACTHKLPVSIHKRGDKTYLENKNMK